MEISPSITRCASQNTSCVECMCLMTLIQEHVSAKHSMMDAVYFELSEWQQSGYKQTIKWTLECDRCDYKSTSKALMFEHIANHQLLEDTVHRLGQSAPSMSPHAPSATHLTSHNSLPTSLHSTPPPTSTKTSSSSTSKPRKKNVPFKADIFHKKYLQPPKLSHKLAPYLTSNKMEPVEITSPVSAVYSPETLSDHTQSLVDSSRESDVTATVEVTNKTAEDVVIKMDEEDIADGLGNQTDTLADNSFQFNNGFHPIGEFSLEAFGDLERSKNASHARRSYTVSEKLFLLDKSNEMGMTTVAKAFRIDRSLLQRWRLSRDKLEKACQFNAHAIKLKTEDYNRSRLLLSQNKAGKLMQDDVENADKALERVDNSQVAPSVPLLNTGLSKTL